MLLRYTKSARISSTSSARTVAVIRPGPAYQTRRSEPLTTHVSVSMPAYGASSPRSRSDVTTQTWYRSCITDAKFAQDRPGPPALYPGSYQSVKITIVFLFDMISLEPMLQYHEQQDRCPADGRIALQKILPVTQERVTMDERPASHVPDMFIAKAEQLLPQPIVPGKYKPLLLPVHD